MRFKTADPNKVLETSSSLKNECFYNVFVKNFKKILLL